MKKVFSVLVILLFCFSLPVKASASTIPTVAVQPYYEITNDAKSTLLINGTTASCNSSVQGYSGVVKITAMQTLQKQGFLWSWSKYDGAEWTKTVYTNALAMSNTKTGLSSGKYRLKTVFTLTDKNGETEKITVYSDEKSVS